MNDEEILKAMGVHPRSHARAAKRINAAVSVFLLCSVLSLVLLALLGVVSLFKLAF